MGPFAELGLEGGREGGFVLLHKWLESTIRAQRDAVFLLAGGVLTGPLSLSLPAALPAQQALPVDLSSSGIRNPGGGSFHGASAFDPCCPGSSSRTSLYGHQAGTAASQPISMDGYSTSMVPQPQPPTQASCRHYLHSPCKWGA